MRVENVEQWARAHERLFQYEQGHAYAMPATLQDALVVAIPRNLVASWLFYCEKHPPVFPIRHFVWDIRRLVHGDYEFAEEWLAPVLAEWGDPEDLEALWTEADRPYEDGKDVLVLRALASLSHEEDDEGGLWVLLPDGDEGASDEVEAIKQLHRLFYELDSAEIEQLEIAAGVTNPAALAAMRAKGLLRLTDSDLAALSIRDRLRIENEIMMARYEAQKAIPCPLPLPGHPNLTAQQAVALEDFYACLPAGAYIFTPTREMWPSTSVNSKIGPVTVPMREKPIQASTWLAKHRAVEQMTWAPGRPMVIADKLIADGGWIDRQGCSVFNLYRAPVIKPVAGDASLWTAHIARIFETDAAHIIKWLAHRVQRPEQKINHALVLGGPQGIGKDTMLEPVKQAIGPWNFTEVSPVQMLGRFNGFVKSVILRISEARDLGEVDRYGFYEHMKTLTAAPPDVLRVDEKHLREHAVLNVCGVIITTNNKDSMHLPADDRRHFVAWSARTKDDFGPDYWNKLYNWFGHGGSEIVAHHLATLDLTDFDPKAPPPKTRAFWEMVDSSRAPEDAEMADALDALGKPDAVTVGHVLTRAASSFGEWLQDRRNRRKIPHRFEECDYVAVRNPSAGDGYWVVNGKRAPVYAKCELSLRDQIAAAERLSAAGLQTPP
ncbi:primase-helicase family protein, partial [Bradyrhizobium glycinis]|uniref:primase-helicase family protein n=1 Tax=Bradyrhizobium glycinis TaxID=2751812 RepID=UPI0018D6A18C